MKVLKTGILYEFSDDNISWEIGVLEAISTSVPLTYQSKYFNKYEWHTFIREVASKPKPAPAQAYTQEMADNGVQVEAGMKFATEAGGYIAEYTNKKSVCFTDENGFLVTITRGYAKPLTPPITLIDGKAYQFDYRNIETCGVYSKDHNLLYSADSIIDISDCTNIQPLTVEVK